MDYRTNSPISSNIEDRRVNDITSMLPFIARLHHFNPIGDWLNSVGREDSRIVAPIDQDAQMRMLQLLLPPPTSTGKPGAEHLQQMQDWLPTVRREN